MIPEIKGMWLDSATHDLETYLPESKDSFGIWIQFRVGILDQDGGDDFSLLVCSPEWLRRECSNQEAVWGRHMLILNEYNFERISAAINLQVKKCVGDDWLTIAREISTFALWEFYLYKDDGIAVI